LRSLFAICSSYPNLKQRSCTNDGFHPVSGLTMISLQRCNIVRRTSRSDNSTPVTLNILAGSDIEMRVFAEHAQWIPGTETGNKVCVTGITMCALAALMICSSLPSGTSVQHSMATVAA